MSVCDKPVSYMLTQHLSLIFKLGASATRTMNISSTDMSSKCTPSGFADVELLHKFGKTLSDSHLSSEATAAPAGETS